MTHHITDEQIERVAAEIALSLGEPWSFLRKPDKQKLKDAARAVLALAAPQGEPFGYFRARPFGWEQCAEDDEGAVALYTAPAPQGEPITVNAVATVRGRSLQWLIEGGIAGLPDGAVLVVSDEPITDECGAGEVYTAPAPAVPSDAEAQRLVDTLRNDARGGRAATVHDLDAAATWIEAALTAAPTPPAQSEPVQLGELAKRNIYDAIRGAYDLGYNDARNARSVPGDSAPGYEGRNVEADHGGALLNSLNQRLRRATATPAVPEDVARLDALGTPGWELSMNDDPECGPDELWQVHRVSGGRNDREWTLIGSGANPRTAIDAARKAGSAA